MGLCTEEKHGVLEIRLFGELDHHSSMQLREPMDLALSATCAKKVLYSLEELTFMDSSGISLLAHGAKIAKVLGAKVTVYVENEKHLAMFQMAKMDDFAQFITNRKELEQFWKSSMKRD